MKTKNFLATAILLVFAMQFAAAETGIVYTGNLELSFSKNYLELEQGQFASVTASAKNNYSSPKCFSLVASTDDSDITASIPKSMKKICLNSMESVSFNFLVGAKSDAANENFNAKLTAEFDSAEITASLDVLVSEDVKDIDLFAFEKTICKNQYNQTISVRVSNNTSSTQTIRLFGESELFLPIFEPREITLEGDEGQFVELLVHANKTMLAGNYEIQIFAETDSGKKSVSTAKFKLIECETPKQQTLEIIATTNCLKLEKGKSISVPVRIKNLLDEAQNVSIEAASELTARLSRKSALIEPKGSVLLDLNVAAGFDAARGNKKISLVAWNNAGSSSREICIEVGTARKIEVEQLNDNLEIQRDEAGIFSFSVKNTGDFPESVPISITNSHSGISVTTAKSSIALAAGEQKNVFVIVAPGIGSILGKKEATVNFNAAAAAGGTITKRINFTVEKEKTSQQTGILKIIAWPEKISAAQGQSVEFELTIENPTGETIDNLELSIKGLPAGAGSVPIKGIYIAAGGKTKVSGAIKIEESAVAGKTTASFNIENSAFKSSAPVEITIAGKNELLSGLFGLASNLAIGIIALVIIAVIFAVFSGKKTQKKESWVAKTG